MLRKKNSSFKFIIFSFIFLLVCGCSSFFVKLNAKAMAFDFQTEISQTAGVAQEDLESYQSACDRIKGITSYADSDADEAMTEYALAKNKLVSSEYFDNYKDIEAENNYSILTTQKNLKRYYDESCSTLMTFDSCVRENKDEVQNALDNYSLKKEAMISNNQALSCFINVQAENKYQLLIEQRDAIREQLIQPALDANHKGYVYNGLKYYFCRSNNNLSGIILGVDKTKMLVQGDNGNSDAGTYDVFITPKEGYEWQTTQGRETLKFSIKIEKADYDLEGVRLESRTFRYDGMEHRLEFVDPNNKLAVLGDALWEGNFKIQPGIYNVKASFTADKNHNQVKPFEAVLTINMVKVSSFDESLNEIVRLESATSQSYIECGSIIKVNSFDKAKQPLSKDDLSYKQNIKQDEEIVFSYEISLHKDNVEVQPIGKTTIKMKLPSCVYDKEFRLIHIHGDESFKEVEQLEYTLEEDYIVFTVNSLSTFSFVTKIDKSMSIWIIMLIVMVSLALFVILLLFGLYLKQNKIKQIEYNAQNKLVNNEVKMITMANDNSQDNLNNVEEEYKTKANNKVDKEQNNNEVIDKKVEQEKEVEKTVKIKTKKENKADTGEKTLNTKKNKAKRGRPKKPAKRGRPKKPAKRGRPKKNK